MRPVQLTEPQYRRLLDLVETQIEVEENLPLDSVLHGRSEQPQTVVLLEIREALMGVDDA